MVSSYDDSIKKRVLLIGLDAGDAELIDKWCDAGLLPNISRLREQGIWASMRTTAEILHVSAWASIFTGTEPDKHGLYHALVMNPGQQSPIRPRPDMSPYPFMWQLLSEKGLQSVIMDAFMTCPLQNFNGTQILEWGTWTWFWEPTILPETLGKKIREKFGSYPAENHSKVGMTPPDHEGFYHRLLSAIERKSKVVKWLMAEEDWDFFLVVFGESHPAGHYFWHFQDPSYIAYPGEKDRRLRDALLNVYIALDKAIGDILETVDDNTIVFLVSGDGIGPNYSGSHILNDLLSRMELLNNMKINKNGTAEENHTGAGRAKRVKSDLLSVIRNMIPKQIRATVSKTLLPRSVNEKLSLRWKTAGISWEHTRAFTIENANEGYIRINLIDREPHGIVETGMEYEALCESLYQTACSMTNPANGLLGAHTVYKTDKIYSGPCRSHMPDIIINWDEAAKITTQLLTENYGTACSQKSACEITPFYTGNHRPNAFMIATGPNVPQGKTLNLAHILDLAPTILAYLGIDPPDYMDGKVLSEIHNS